MSDDSIPSRDLMQQRDETRRQVDHMFHYLQQKVIDLAKEIHGAHATLTQQLNELDKRAEIERNHAVKEQAANKKKKRQPSGRPMTAYLMFCRENRQRVASEFAASALPREITVALAKRWKELSPSEAQPYHERYRKALEQYYAERPQERGAESADGDSQLPNENEEEGDEPEDHGQADEHDQETNGEEYSDNHREHEETPNDQEAENGDGSENKRGREEEEEEPAELSTFGPGLDQNHRKKRKKSKKKKHAQHD